MKLEDTMALACKVFALLGLAMLCSVLVTVSARKPTMITGEKMDRYPKKVECDPQKEVLKMAECDYPHGRFGKYGMACPRCSTVCGRLFFRDVDKEHNYPPATSCCCRKTASIQAWWLSVDRTN